MQLKEGADLCRVDEPVRTVVDGARYVQALPRIADAVDVQQRQRDVVRARAVRKEAGAVQHVAAVDEPARAIRALIEQAQAKAHRIRVRIVHIGHEPNDVVDDLRAVKVSRRDASIWQSNAQL